MAWQSRNAGTEAGCPGRPTEQLRRHRQRGLPGADQVGEAFQHSDDGVECSRDWLQHHDQHSEDRSGGDGVLQQLQPGIVGGEPLSGDPGPDHGGNEEAGADRLG
jgi:hypothetical protein